MIEEPNTSLERAVTKLWELTDSLPELTSAYENADRSFKIAYAQAYRQAEGTVQNREATATLAAQEALERLANAKAALDANKQVSHNVRAIIDAERTRSANSRSLERELGRA